MEVVEGNESSVALAACGPAPLVLSRPDLAALYIYGYSTVMVIGIVANTLSFVVLARDKSRTTTRIFLLSLACIDTTILITYLLYYPLRSIVELHQLTSLFFVQENEPYVYAATNLFKLIQIWLVLVISADRYFAIHYPLRAPKVCTLRNAKIACSTIVVSSVAFNIPRLLRYHRVAVFDSCYNMTVFRFVPKDLLHETFVTIYWDVADPIMYYFVPLLSLVTLNALLIRAVKKANALRERLSSQGKQENNITCTLVAIVSNFILCESPTVILYGFELCFRITDGQDSVCSLIVYKDETALAVSTLLLLVNSSINFFLYILIGKKFRRLFLETCCDPFLALCFTAAANTDSGPLNSNTTLLTTYNHNHNHNHNNINNHNHNHNHSHVSHPHVTNNAPKSNKVAGICEKSVSVQTKLISTNAC